MFGMCRGEEEEVNYSGKIGIEEEALVPNQTRFLRDMFMEVG
jgi:hypothetical protein